MRCDGNSIRRGFCEGNSRTENVFQWVLIDRAIFRSGDVFHDRRLPETAVTTGGYAALIDAYKLSVPVPRTFPAIGTKHRIVEQGGWRIYTPRHAPEASLAEAKRPPIPTEGGHRFRSKATTQSEQRRPPC
jgi:hypothetical protein